MERLSTAGFQAPVKECDDTRKLERDKVENLGRYALEGVKKSGGRASWRAIGPARLLSHEARREPRPPGHPVILQPTATPNSE
jgi:hypothetical protein